MTEFSDPYELLMADIARCELNDLLQRSLEAGRVSRAVQAQARRVRLRSRAIKAGRIGRATHLGGSTVSMTQAGTEP